MTHTEAFNKIMSEIGKQLNEETITAIKAALEANDEPAPVAKNEGGRITWMIDDWPQNCLLYTHLPKQEAKDEPVGVVATDTSKTHLYYGTQYLGQKTDTKMVMLFKDLPLGTPVYTTPPQRKPLTDEEIASIYMNHTDRPMHAQWDFARAIEAAHGITGENK